MPWPLLGCQQDGTVCFANDAFASLIGASTQELLGRSVADLGEAEPGEVSIFEIFHHVEEGLDWAGTWYLQTRQGKQPLDITVEADPDAVGRFWIIGLEGAHATGKTRLSSHSDLRLLKIILDHTLDHIFFTDVEGRIILANAAFQRALGIPKPDQEVGHRPEEYLSEESALRFEEARKQVWATLRPVINHESELIFQNGQKRWMQTTHAPVLDRYGRCIGVLAVSRDISDIVATQDELRSALRQAEEASRVKTQFIANVSHEIRTPINGIIGMAELCRSHQTSLEAQRNLETILSCSSTLLGLVNDILDFSRLESKQFELETMPFDLLRCVEEVCEQFAPAISQRNLVAGVYYDPRTVRTVAGDARRLKQVLGNLLGNAIKFTEAGEVGVIVRDRGSDSGYRNVEIEVFDTGIGIEPSKLDQIFESFRQADASIHCRYGGAGLGLSITRELIERMNGTISVASQPNEGSRFRVALPLAEVGTHSAPRWGVPVTGVSIVDHAPGRRQHLGELFAALDLPARGYGAMQELPDDVLADPDHCVMVAELCLNNWLAAVPPKGVLSCWVVELCQQSENSLTRFVHPLFKRLTGPFVPTRLRQLLENWSEASIVADHIETADLESMTPIQILLVEDNLINQEVQQRRLARLGHEVLIAGNGVDAVEAFTRQNFDLVLMDLQLPDIDGFEITRALRQREREGEQRSIIVGLSAQSSREDQTKCFASGMDDFLAKPILGDDLRNLIVKWFAEFNNSAEMFENEPSYDPHAWSSRMNQEDREDFCAAAQVFLQYAASERERATNACLTENWNQLEELAHGIKGSAGLLGAFRLQGLANRLENIAKTGQTADLPKAQEALLAEFDHVARELKNFLDS